jgi:hypothetical protein
MASAACMPFASHLQGKLSVSAKLAKEPGINNSAHHSAKSRVVNTGTGYITQQSNHQ